MHIVGTTGNEQQIAGMNKWMYEWMDELVYRVPSYEFITGEVESERPCRKRTKNYDACVPSQSFKKYSLIAFTLIFYWIINNPQVRDKP